MFALTSLAVLAACASSPAASSVSGGSGEQWTGSLQQTTQRTGELAPVSQQRATGSILLVPSAGDSTRMQVRLTVSTPGFASSSLRWAILPGRCGASAIPILGYEHFPRLDIGSNGRGQIALDLPIRLEPGATYHVDVYRGTGTQVTDVLTCGNLRQSS